MKKVQIYTTPTCPYCHKAMDYLKDRNIDFENIDLGKNQEKVEEMIDKSGQMGVPVLDIGGKIIVGFNIEEIESALKEGKSSAGDIPGGKDYFSEEEIDKKIFEDRWVRFAFGPQGKIKTKNLNLGITEFEKGIVSLTHTHNVDEALYILEGKGAIKLGKSTVDVKRGDFISIPSGTPHTIITGRDSILKIFFVFSGEITIEN